MKASLPAPFFQRDLREALESAIATCDMEAIFNLSPKINWIGLYARWNADENFNPDKSYEGIHLDMFRKAARHFLFTADAAPGAHVQAWELFCFSALDYMVASGYRLLDDPSLSWCLKVAMKGDEVELATIRAVSRACCKHGLRCEINQTLLHIAVKGLPDASSIASAILVPGMDVNAIDDEGCTPLHSLWNYYDYQELDEVGPKLIDAWIEVAQLLLERGADPFVKNADGCTSKDVMIGGLVEYLEIDKGDYKNRLIALMDKAGADQLADQLSGATIKASARPHGKSRL